MDFKVGQVVTCKTTRGLKRDGYITEIRENTCMVQLNLNAMLFFKSQIFPYECSEPSLKSAMECQIARFNESQEKSQEENKKEDILPKWARNNHPDICMCPSCQPGEYEYDEYGQLYLSEPTYMQGVIFPRVHVSQKTIYNLHDED